MQVIQDVEYMDTNIKYNGQPSHNLLGTTHLKGSFIDFRNCISGNMCNRGCSQYWAKEAMHASHRVELDCDIAACVILPSLHSAAALYCMFYA